MDVVKFSTPEVKIFPSMVNLLCETQEALFPLDFGGQVWFGVDLSFPTVLLEECVWAEMSQ